jgi:hypothetical protein
VVKGIALARREEGQMVVLFAISMLAFLFMLGIAIDGGALFVANRTAQEAADAGAYGGALVMHHSGSIPLARSAAAADVQRNGFVDGGDGGLTKVTINIPPMGGAYAKADYVEVIIERQVRTFFIAPGSLNRVVVRGVAGAAPGDLGHALMALHPSENAALKVGGPGTIQVTGGGVMVNSDDCPAALHLSGAGGIDSPYTHVVGCVRESGRGEVTPSALRWPDPDPDPLLKFVGPDVTGLPVRGSASFSDNGTYTLLPGVYPDGIRFSGSGKVYLMPGVYVLKEKGLQVTGNGELRMHPSAAPEDGVLLYNTIEGYPGSSPTTCGPVQLAGNGIIDLRAMSTGDWKGLLIFQDRRCTKEMLIAGNGGIQTVTGTIYVPQAPILIAGNGAFDARYNSRIIAQTVTSMGSATFHLHYDSSENAQTFLPGLVE